MPKKASILLCLLLSCLILGGCSALNPFASSRYSGTAKELFQAGEGAMEDGEYADAAKYFQSIKEDHPFSRYAAEAEIGLADAYFQQEKYTAAESAYKEFDSLYPGDPKIPYVLYRIGVVNLRQYTSIDLSQRAVQEAAEYFTRLIQAHSGSEYAAKAKARLEKCRSLEAYHEIHVADFYMRTQKYQAAWLRYRSVLQNSSDLKKELTEYARKKSQEAYYLSLRQASEEVRTAKRGSWKQWFDWL